MASIAVLVVVVTIIEFPLSRQKVRILTAALADRSIHDVVLIKAVQPHPLQQLLIDALLRRRSVSRAPGGDGAGVPCKVVVPSPLLALSGCSPKLYQNLDSARVVALLAADDGGR